MEPFIAIAVVVIIAQLTYLTYRIKPARTRNMNDVFIDTSALMDGRILTIAKTGFINPRLVIPKSVIAELQLLADQADSEKRARARAGLDAVKELQGMEMIVVTILDDGPLEEGGVDARLVALAMKNGGQLCTIDYNLNKVATINGIFVLNINELAQSIRMAFLPGETLRLELAQKGQDSHQAVGYLPDGTMVVVEKAAKHIGTVVEVEFIRSLQTAAGRMMFAKLASGHDNEEQSGQTDKQSSSRSKRRITKPVAVERSAETGLTKEQPVVRNNRGRRSDTNAPTQTDERNLRPRQARRPRSTDREDDLMRLLGEK